MEQTPVKKNERTEKLDPEVLRQSQEDMEQILLRVRDLTKLLTNICNLLELSPSRL